MAVTFDTTNFNEVITDGVTNSGVPSEDEINGGVVYNSYSDAVILNKFLYNMSSALEYIQSNGSIMWQKGKAYKLGSIVATIELRNSFYTIRKFRCIKVDAGDVTKQQPLIGSLNIIPDNLSVYFSGVTSVNTTYWTEIFEKDDQKIKLYFIEGIHGVSLFDIPKEGHYVTNIDVNIKRYNTNTNKYDSLRFTLFFEANDYNDNNDNIYMSVYNVNCTNYKRTSVTPSGINALKDLSEDEYVFGESKFALLGITVSTFNGKLNIDVYNDDKAYISTLYDMHLHINVNKSDITINPTEIQTYNGYVGEEVLVIREGADNSGVDCGYVVESTTRYTTEEQFKRGLLMLTDDNCILDTSERPGYSKNFTNQFNPDNVISIVSDITNRDYSTHVLPLIEGYGASVDSNKGWDTHSNFGYSLSSLLAGAVIGDFADPSISLHFEYGTLYPIYQGKMTMTVTSNDKTKNIFNSKNPELNINTTKPSLYPKSVRVYRYFKY